MSTTVAADFDQADLLQVLESLDAHGLDGLEFGVIGFAADGLVTRYNRNESQQSGLEPERVLGHDVFTVVAQCLNNFLVAQRFEDAAAEELPLDETIDYVLTWRMRPCKVRLRMLWAPAVDTRYIAIERH